MRPTPGRLLLIEFFPGALRRNEKSMLFPFLQGLARRIGWESQWLCFGGDAAPCLDRPAGRSTLARLSAMERAALRRRLSKYAPTHVVTSDLLSPETAALLNGAKHLVMPTLFDAGRREDDPEMAPYAAACSADPRRGDYFGKCGWFLDWLGAPEPALAGRHLIAGVEPDYAAVPANESARRAPGHITLVSGSLCGDRHKLAANPLFKGLDLGGARFGCSFCSSAGMPSLTPPGASPTPLLERQLRAIRKTAGPAKDAGVYEFYDFQALWRCGEVFAAVQRQKLPPSIFLFNPRIDEVLRLRAPLEKILPALARAGHEMRFLSMGIENFSERENARLNKGVTPAQVDAFLALMKEWQARWPGAVKPFKAGHAKIELGFILFTPWTTLADVRLNLEQARNRGFSERGYWLYSTLMIRRAEPIHALAQKDGGLLTERWPDAGQGYGQFKNEGEMGPMVPWRFRDQRTADYFSLLVRVCAADREGKDCAFFKNDPDFALVRGLYDGARRRRRLTPLAAALNLLTTMEGSAGRPPEEALREALSMAPPRVSVPRTRRIPGSLRARAAARAFARLKDTRLRAAAGLTLRSAEELAENGARPLRLTFAAERDQVVVDVFDRETPGPGFLRTQRSRAVRRGTSPEISPAQTRFLSLLLRLAEAGR